MKICFKTNVTSTIALAVALAGCGGGGGDERTATTMGTAPAATTGNATLAPAAPSAPATLPAGAIFTMPQNTIVNIPSGTTVTSPTGSVVTVNGTSNTINTQAGAIVRVPVTAMGPATNTVNSGPAISASPAPELTVVPIAGSPTAGPGSPAVDGTGAAAVFYGGGKLALDGSGNIIVSDSGALRKVTPAGVVTTLTARTGTDDWIGVAIDTAGNYYGSSASPLPLIRKFPSVGAPVNIVSGSIPSFSQDLGLGPLAVDAGRNFYLMDASSEKIAKYSVDGVWSVLAENGQSVTQGGVAAPATLGLSRRGDMPIDSDGNLYVVSGTAIKKISPAGVVTTIASNLESLNGSSGALALDKSGNLYAASNSGFGIYRILKNSNLASWKVSNSAPGFITSMVADKDGVIYVGTRGSTAQIFKVIF